MARWLGLASLLALVLPAWTAGNLLRNGSFQDDWLTRVTEVKNHHYCFSSEHYNRRDYNPDGWECRGSWTWQNADAPQGQRRLMLRGPNADIAQRVNWVLVHDEKSLTTMADAGRFPVIAPVTSKAPSALVRDLVLRVQVRATDAAENAGTLELGLCPPGAVNMETAFGTKTTPTVLATAPIPAGTYDWRWVEVALPAAQWLAATKTDDAKGPVLPGTVHVAIKYTGAGQAEIGQAVLEETGAALPNLLPNGGFEAVDAAGYPTGWSAPEKYFFFPPGNYYLFNTWQNSPFDNRGPVATDRLITHGGGRSLKMLVPAGDEKFVASAPIPLNQAEPRLIEVQAWVKTDHLCMLQIDGLDESGQRLDGMLFIHKAQVSIGTDDWRLVRQVFRPRKAVKSLQLRLCARGVNGYALDDTGWQPQNLVCGTIWWDDIRVSEPETPAAELTARGVKVAPVAETAGGLRLERLSLGEQLIGQNVLRAGLFSAGPEMNVTVKLSLATPSGKASEFTVPATIGKGKTADIALPYTLEACPNAYTEYRGTLSVVDGKQNVLASSELWSTAWPSALDLQLGNLYLSPAQTTQLVRANIGLASASMAQAATLRLTLLKRGTAAPLTTLDLPVTSDALAAQRTKIPSGLRGDFTNLRLADLNVAALPVLPFDKPERNWFVRAVVLDAAGKEMATSDSPGFCRLANDPVQPPVQKVNLDTDGLLYVNDRPWMPWGVIYGFQPVYDGPADPGPGKVFDMSNLPGWSIYDRFTGTPYNRARNDFNTMRYIAGITPKDTIEKAWATDNLYASSVFLSGGPMYDPKEVAKHEDYLAFLKTAPMAVSTAPGIEEAFSLFTAATPEQLRGLEETTRLLREKTGKPVMVGHGGFWNRFEWEKVPFFDIYDPETEPFYPGNIHTDLRPLIAGQAKTVWLRPQMYEDVPYERWRFHTYVELMRGCRGWQFAHGPGDQSLFRGLHAEMKRIEPVAYAKDRGPAIALEPWIEHFSRRVNGKTTLIAATTHGMTVGTWRWSEERDAQAGRAKVTERDSEFRTAANNYGTDAFADRGPRAIGIENLPDAHVWPAGSKLTQWVKLDDKAVPQGLLVLAKVNGRWTAAGQWGQFNLAGLKGDEAKAHWFLSMFYRNAQGFAFQGWYGKPLPFALAECVPGTAAALGALPAPGGWVKLEIPLAALGAEGKLVDGFAFLHETGTVNWGRMAVVTPDGKESVIWGDQIGPSPEALAKVTISVAGLKAGTRVNVLYEDREIIAGDGFFTDDFRGQDLYQRFGGGLNGGGYGDTPVALHIYEIP